MSKDKKESSGLMEFLLGLFLILLVVRLIVWAVAGIWHQLITM